MKMELQIEKRKLELIQWLSTLEDLNILDKISALKKEQKDWWDTISDDEKASIEKGIEQANAGNLKPHSEARKLYEKWL
jgi:hypothetical protein